MSDLKRKKQQHDKKCKCGTCRAKGRAIRWQQFLRTQRRKKGQR